MPLTLSRCAGSGHRAKTGQEEGKLRDLKALFGRRGSRSGRVTDEATIDSLVEFIEVAPAPIGLNELAAYVNLEPRQIAAQLAELCEKGRVVRLAGPPGDQGGINETYWRGLLSESPQQDAYLGLSEMLLQVVIAGRDPEEIGRLAGRLIGRAVARNDPGEPDPIAQLGAYLQQRGYQPRKVGAEPHIAFVLGRCPFEEAALANPRVVCGLHRALVRGMAETLGGTFEVTGLDARDPATAGCRLRLRTIDPAERLASVQEQDPCDE